jgi:hypothetical protein
MSEMLEAKHLTPGQGAHRAHTAAFRSRSRVVCAVLAIACLFSVTSIHEASAGTDGQQLSLRDVAGYIYSAFVSGYNNSCNYEIYGITSWQNHDYDIPGWYWQQWTGSEGGNNCGGYQVSVSAYAAINYGSLMYEDFYLNGPPHSQSSDWWSCEIDSIPVACATGLHAFG